MSSITDPTASDATHANIVVSVDAMGGDRGPGQIVAGKKPGREPNDDRTMAVNLGLALEDMATGIRLD